MIHFACERCGQKLKVPESRAGTISRCPRCKNGITIPSATAEPEIALVREPAAPDSGRASGPIVQNAPGRSARIRRAQEAEARQRAEELLALRDAAAASEQASEPKPYGPSDLLLYPFSLTGTITLVAMIAYPLLLGLLSAFGPLHLLLRTRPSLMVNGVAGLCVGWYLAECVYDSARGGTRAPEALDMGNLGDLWSRFSYLAAVYIVYGLPAVLYWTIARRFDAIFWALAAWAMAFLPMGLLAMVINDSVSALNPLFLLDSIRRVFLPYMGLLVLIAGLVGLCWLLPIALSQGAPPVWFAVIALVVSAYGVFLFAHVLGRFYWRHRERLDWGL